MLKIALPVGLVGLDGCYTDKQIIARAAVAEKTGIPIIPQITLYGSGYNKEVVNNGVRDLKAILQYDADSDGLLVHEDYRTNVFFDEGLERAKRNMSHFTGQNVAMFLVHFPKLLDYGLPGLLYQRTLSRTRPDFRGLTGRSLFDKSPFDMEEYDAFVQKSVESTLKAKEYASSSGFESAFTVETVNAHDFIVVPPDKDLDLYFGGREGFARFLGEESQIEFMDRPHIKLERAIAGGIDLGGLTCTLEEINGFSRKTGVPICMDSEHLNIDHLISQRYTTELLERLGKIPTREENRDLLTRGFTLIRGLPRIYNVPLNAENIVANVANPSKVAHMTGGFEAEIRDCGIIVSGAHIGIDPKSNFFLDERDREVWWNKTKELVPRFARLMEDNGVKIVVLEPKLGTYVDGKFIISFEEPHYSPEMSKTVQNFVQLTK